MPLKKGDSRATVSTNIHEMVAAGHPVRQAVAASLREADEANEKKAKGKRGKRKRSGPAR